MLGPIHEQSAEHSDDVSALDLTIFNITFLAPVHPKQPPVYFICWTALYMPKLEAGSLHVFE